MTTGVGIRGGHERWTISMGEIAPTRSGSPYICLWAPEYGIDVHLPYSEDIGTLGACASVPSIGSSISTVLLPYLDVPYSTSVSFSALASLCI